MVNFKEDEQLKTLNHSCAHVMAQAIKHLYPQAKFWVGPVVAEGFYYDIDLGEDVIRDEDIEKITKEMKKVVKSGKKIIRREVSKEEALEMFADDPYKLDLIADLEEGSITVYDQGDFTDLCRGPHVDNVKLCKHFKLIRHSGAYWKGDSKNKMLQRIYGVCFPTAEELEEHIEQRRLRLEAKIAKLNPDALKHLREHRKEVLQRFKENNPEAYAHMIQHRKEHISRLEKEKPELAAKMKEFYKLDD